MASTHIGINGCIKCFPSPSWACRGFEIDGEAEKMLNRHSFIMAGEWLNFLKCANPIRVGLNTQLQTLGSLDHLYRLKLKKLQSRVDWQESTGR